MRGERLSVTMAREHVENGHGGKYAHYCYRCEHFEAQRAAWEWQVAAIDKPRAWLSPGRRWGVGFGDDEYQRRTFYVGPLVVALWRCRCADCRAELARIRELAETDHGQIDRDKQREVVGGE